MASAAYAWQQAPAPIERRPPSYGIQSGNPPARPAPAASAPGRSFRGPSGEHLSDWLSQHGNLPLDQQQHALEREPGFRDLPPETQQRYRNRLAQLDSMKPQRRERILARNEAMERLSPEQRAQVRGALGQLGSLPPDQRRVVAATFRALRGVPPDQRLAALDSGRYGPPLTPSQRFVLNGLLNVEPILPFPSRSASAPYPQQPYPPPQAYPR